jgi:hypothetical protein
MMNTLNLSEQPQPVKVPQGEELSEFKQKVQQWLAIDEEIMKNEKRIRDLRKHKNKVLEPEITSFMRAFNISDLNTSSGGKLRCNERHAKQPLNKTNIRENLSIALGGDEHKISNAMELILQNREVYTTYKLTKPKR